MLKFVVMKLFNEREEKGQEKKDISCSYNFNFFLLAKEAMEASCDGSSGDGR